MENPSLKAFHEARDFLIKNREDYEAAYHGFRWPSLDRFNWALDWFDVIAKDNNSLALRVFSESGEERSRTFRSSRRSRAGLQIHSHDWE